MKTAAETLLNVLTHAHDKASKAAWDAAEDAFLQPDDKGLKAKVRELSAVADAAFRAMSAHRSKMAA